MSFRQSVAGGATVKERNRHTLRVVCYFLFNGTAYFRYICLITYNLFTGFAARYAESIIVWS